MRLFPSPRNAKEFCSRCQDENKSSHRIGYGMNTLEQTWGISEVDQQRNEWTVQRTRGQKIAARSTDASRCHYLYRIKTYEKD